MPNFVNEADVDRWRRQGKGKTRPKKGAKRPQDLRPSIAGMVEFLGQDINNLPDQEIKDYIRLRDAGVITGHAGKKRTKETFIR